MRTRSISEPLSPEPGLPAGPKPPPCHIDDSDCRSSFHRELYAQQQSGLLCDHHLITAEASYPVHRVVLVASSPHFKRQFTMAGEYEFCETWVRQRLQGMDSPTMKALIQYMYTGCCHVDEQVSVEHLVTAAGTLLMRRLLLALQTHIALWLVNTPAQAIRWYKLSIHYDMPQVLDSALRVMCQHLNEVLETPGFLSLPLRDVASDLCIVSLLFDHLRPRLVNEDRLLHALLQWAREDPQRWEDVNEPMNRMREFRHLGNEMWNGIGLYMELGHCSEAMLTVALRDYGRHLDESVKYQMGLDLKAIRLSRKRDGELVVVGGRRFATQAVTKEGTASWDHRQHLPFGVRNYSMCAIGSRLFVTGGLRDGQPTDKCIVYSDGIWQDFRHMPLARFNHMSVVVGTCVYILGGELTVPSGAHQHRPHNTGNFKHLNEILSKEVIVDPATRDVVEDVMDELLRGLEHRQTADVASDTRGNNEPAQKIGDGHKRSHAATQTCDVGQTTDCDTGNTDTARSSKVTEMNHEHTHDTQTSNDDDIHTNVTAEASDSDTKIHHTEHIKNDNCEDSDTLHGKHTHPGFSDTSNSDEVTNDNDRGPPIDHAKSMGTRDSIEVYKALDSAIIAITSIPPILNRSSAELETPTVSPGVGDVDSGLSTNQTDCLSTSDHHSHNDYLSEPNVKKKNENDLPECEERSANNDAYLVVLRAINTSDNKTGDFKRPSQTGSDDCEIESKRPRLRAVTANDFSDSSSRNLGKENVSGVREIKRALSDGNEDKPDVEKKRPRLKTLTTEDTVEIEPTVRNDFQENGAKHNPFEYSKYQKKQCFLEQENVNKNVTADSYHHDKPSVTKDEHQDERQTAPASMVNEREEGSGVHYRHIQILQQCQVLNKDAMPGCKQTKDHASANVARTGSCPAAQGNQDNIDYDCRPEEENNTSRAGRRNSTTDEEHMKEGKNADCTDMVNICTRQVVQADPEGEVKLLDGAGALHCPSGSATLYDDENQDHLQKKESLARDESECYHHPDDDTSTVKQEHPQYKNKTHKHESASPPDQPASSALMSTERNELRNLSCSQHTQTFHVGTCTAHDSSNTSHHHETKNGEDTHRGETDVATTTDHSGSLHCPTSRTAVGCGIPHQNHTNGANSCSVKSSRRDHDNSGADEAKSNVPCSLTCTAGAIPSTPRPEVLDDDIAVSPPCPTAHVEHQNHGVYAAAVHCVNFPCMLWQKEGLSAMPPGPGEAEAVTHAAAALGTHIYVLRSATGRGRKHFVQMYDTVLDTWRPCAPVPLVTWPITGRLAAHHHRLYYVDLQYVSVYTPGCGAAGWTLLRTDLGGPRHCLLVSLGKNLLIGDRAALDQDGSVLEYQTKANRCKSSAIRWPFTPQFAFVTHRHPIEEEDSSDSPASPEGSDG